MFVKLGGLKLYLESYLLRNRNESHGLESVFRTYLYSLSPVLDPGFSENPVPEFDPSVLVSPNPGSGSRSKF
jgi:hypothetical protein